MHSFTRFAPIVALAFTFTGFAMPAAASPVTPTFALQWGQGQGTGPGQFFASNYVFADGSGNVFVVDSGAARILKYDGLGNFLFEFGSNGFGDGQFQAPYGLTTDAAGNIYVTDFTLCRVQKFTSTGAFVAKWGTSGSADGSFDQVRGIAIDAAGSVYVADSGNHRIQKFDAAGNFLAKWGTVGSGNGQLNNPTSVAIDPSGNVYVCDTNNSRIQKFTSTGTYLAQWGSFGSGNGQFQFAWGVGVDAVGNVYVADNGNNRIQKFTGAGVYLTQWGSMGTGDGQFDAPVSLSIDTEANVYVMETGNHRVQKFSGAGVLESRWPMTYAFDLRGPTVFNTFFSPAGIGAVSGPYVYVAQASGIVRARSFGGATFELYGSPGSGDGQYSLPSGVATDAAGLVYVADTNNNRIQKLTANGVFITKWGSLGTGNGQFNSPAAIAIDPAGNVFVVDQVNHRIQKFTTNGAYLLQWGSLGSGNGQFGFAAGIAIDRNGIVYVADSDSTGNNARVQKFTVDGTYLGQWPMPLGATPDDIAVDAAGNVYVPTGNGGHVFRLTSNGLLLNTFNLGPGTIPAAVGVDPAGSVYIGEAGSGRVLKYMISPTITLASDVPADEGGRVTVRIRPTSADSPNSGFTVLGYDVYMRSGPLSPAAGPDDSPHPKLDAYLIPATGAAEYTAVVNTAGDATAAALEHWGLTVRAWTGPYTYYESELHPAMSIDNLPPPVPSPFTVRYISGDVHLHWGVNTAADFTTFRLYRGSDPAFVPGPATLLAATTDTGYVDPAQPIYTYKLSAVDEHGNESPFATVGPGGTVDVPGPQPSLTFALDPTWPNPATGRALTARFTLPRAAAARLELIDVVGRRVAFREVGGLGAGTHTVDLASAGGRTIEAGVYFMRLSQGENAAVRRLVVLD
jgi:tripartite motif-containing protein 71